MNKRFLIPFIFCFIYLGSCLAQGKYKSEITILPEESWWGGLVALGSQMPFEGQIRLFDLSSMNLNNQGVPLMLSSQGRYIWSDKPFAFKVENGILYLFSDEKKLEPVIGGKTLKEAYLAASAAHFSPSGNLPDPLLFSMPQYNTWIELMYNQNQKDILAYAENVKKNGFPTGVFMVDDNWQKYYGNFEFKPDRFPDPKGMIKQLHADGFKIMFWICPFVSPDSPEFRFLQGKGFLIKEKKRGSPAIIPWWNGYSACYDLSNPEAAVYFKSVLKKMQKEYGVDGFKFDAGDVEHYQGNYEFYDKRATSVDMCENWAKIGLEFPFNEYRAGWKMGGQALVQRLGDKNYSWNAVKLLIPDMVAAGLLGHLYTCPDMIGGGQFGSFLGVDQTKLDQKLIVRSCQVHALMPMMQFSVAPWRILNEENLAICRKYAHLHEKMGEYILELAKHAAQTGEPIVRHMEYSFPHQGFATCKDQFMLGDRYLVAPVVTPDDKRIVKLPKGTWKDDEGKKFKGPKVIEIEVPLERLPYYEKIK
ncbi:glycoside hydrolase family 31 protein [Parabacteroides pacaensis]|uniref:glycoside hydrolase family 31 protein n=1 Tax=Parabacteroides pacaensis TaxID=2086575 RepID=UPI000D0F9A5B|nr:glycoside hydrolase family 31 protein [Parabacteroides pacaensis]